LSAPPLHLSPLLAAIKPMLVVNQGKFNFCHQYFQKSVEKQYPFLSFFFGVLSYLILVNSDSSKLFYAQQKLVAYFHTFAFDENVA
jgi:hypothetical protein